MSNPASKSRDLLWICRNLNHLSTFAGECALVAPTSERCWYSLMALERGAEAPPFCQQPLEWDDTCTEDSDRMPGPGLPRNWRFPIEQCGSLRGTIHRVRWATLSRGLPMPHEGRRRTCSRALPRTSHVARRSSAARAGAATISPKCCRDVWRDLPEKLPRASGSHGSRRSGQAYMPSASPCPPGGDREGASLRAAALQSRAFGSELSLRPVAAVAESAMRMARGRSRHLGRQVKVGMTLGMASGWTRRCGWRRWA